MSGVGVEGWLGDFDCWFFCCPCCYRFSGLILHSVLLALLFPTVFFPYQSIPSWSLSFFPLPQPGGFSFSSGFIVIIIIYSFSSKSEVQSKQVSLLQYMYQLPSRVESVKFFKYNELNISKWKGDKRRVFFVFFSFPKSEFWTALFHKEKKEYDGVHICMWYVFIIIYIITYLHCKCAVSVPTNLTPHPPHSLPVHSLSIFYSPLSPTPPLPNILTSISCVALSFFFSLSSLLLFPI